MRISRQAIGTLAAFLLATGCSQAASQSSQSESPESNDPASDTQLVERVSTHSFDETVMRLRAGIEKRPVKLFAEIDHAAGAASADLELAPSTLFIFGNPKGGTPLMAKEPRMGIALPLKMHVFEKDGEVTITHADMSALARQFGLDPDAQPIPNITALLDGLAAEAAE